jgi:microcystin-dependent protein
MGSPVTSNDITILSAVSPVCDRLEALIATPAQFKAFLAWLLNADGDISDEAVSGIADRLTPVGTIVLWGASALPSANWAVCNGALVSVTAYPLLFQRYGVLYGGDGVTNFGLPNLQDRFPAGVSATKSLASTGGSATDTLDLQHYHGVAVTGGNDNFNFLSRDWNIVDNGTSGSVNISGDDVEHDPEPTLEAGDASTTTEKKNDDTGTLSAVVVDTVPPYVALMFIIKLS